MHLNLRHATAVLGPGRFAPKANTPCENGYVPEGVPKPVWTMRRFCHCFTPTEFLAYPVVRLTNRLGVDGRRCESMSA